MSRQETNKIKKVVMSKIVQLIPNVKKDTGRKIIESPKHTIFTLASRDYNYPNGLRNWYGFFNKEIKEIKNKENSILLFTTSDPKYFLMIPFKDFERKIMPYLRITKTGYFFLCERNKGEGDKKNWFIPKDYIPKSLRKEVDKEGISLNNYTNNLEFVGSSYKEYFKLFDSTTPEPTVETVDINSMVRLIAEKDPSFLTKSTEEKLIIIRHNQLKT